MVTHLENFKSYIMLNIRGMLACFCLLLGTEKEVQGPEAPKVVLGIQDLW